ncbi:MAG: MASE1 domain-containing protein, partial [Planctomycetes bacterium]|nr:MASE1 domain-containing protein [Planctomycetota bacterium]
MADATPPTSKASASTAANLARAAAPAGTGLRHLPWDVALLALIYFCSARIALLYAFEKSNASPFWPPAGLALAAVILLGGRAWWGILAGAIAANLVTFIGNGFPALVPMVAMSVVIGAGNASAALLGWVVAGSPRALPGFTLGVGQSARLLLGAAAAGLAAALVGATTVTWGGAAPPSLWPVILRIWALGDAVGMAVLVPLVLAWWCPEPLDPRRRCGWLPYALMMALALVQAGLPGLPAWASAALLAAMALVPVVALLVRARRACWTTALFLISYVIWQTIRGVGPFAGHDEGRDLLQVQLALLGCAPLLLADGLLVGGRLQESTDQGLGLLLHGRGGRSAASLLPALAVTTFGMAVTFTTWWSLLRDQDARLRSAAGTVAQNICQDFTSSATDIRQDLQRSAARWEDAGGTSEDLWRRNAAHTVHDYACLQALEWIDAQTIIRWIEPLAGNQAALNLRLSDEPARRAALE